MNLACGFYAAAMGFACDYSAALYAILAAAVFDFADGFAARLLHAYSPVGKDLDSLADIVSFGVAPGAMLFGFMRSLSLDCASQELCCALSFCALAIPVFSALRLAKFNIDTRQTTSFLGLPVPAHALLWASLIVACAGLGGKGLLIGTNNFLLAFPTDALLPALALLALLTSLLLVSEIPMFSLKLKSLRPKAAQNVYLLTLATIILTTLFGALGISLSVAFYIFLSIITNKRRIRV
jgi:CDP-diacylglycerol--serine O-phosphatidyltransferase